MGKLTFISLLFLPIICEAIIKDNLVVAYAFEDRITLLDTIPKKKSNYFLRKNINRDFSMYEYLDLNGPGFIQRENNTPNGSINDRRMGEVEDEKDYSYWRRTKPENLVITNLDNKKEVILEGGKNYYFRYHKSNSIRRIEKISDDIVISCNVSKKDWDNALNHSYENEDVYNKEFVYVHFKNGKEISYNTHVKPDDHTYFNKYEGYEYYYEHFFSDDYKEDPAYNVIEDKSGVWSCFEDIRNDYKEIVKMITDNGNYAKYQDTVGSGALLWSANIQLKYEEIDYIEIW